MKQTTVNIYCKGDQDYRGSILFIAESKKKAMQYLKDYVHCHSSEFNPLKKDGMYSYNNRFMRVWLEFPKETK
jgi:hypothetical protein